MVAVLLGWGHKVSRRNLCQETVGKSKDWEKKLEVILKNFCDNGGIGRTRSKL
jgi:hypothetical protein